VSKWRHGSVATIPIDGLLQQPNRGDRASDTLLLLYMLFFGVNELHERSHATIHHPSKGRQESKRNLANV